MKKRIWHYFLCVIIALSSIICAASTEDKGFDPKSILADVQDKMNKSKTFSVIEQQEKGGTKIETKCFMKQFGKGDLSFRQEQTAVLPGNSPQTFVSIVDHNKLYYFPTCCGNVAVRMKYLETRKPDSPLANLFFSEGTFERISEADADCLIRYTCTPAEVKALKVAIGKKLGVEIQKDMIPAVLEYKVSKKSMTLLEMTIYSERGKLITKQLRIGNLTLIFLIRHLRFQRVSSSTLLRRLKTRRNFRPN